MHDLIAIFLSAVIPLFALVHSSRTEGLIIKVRTTSMDTYAGKTTVGRSHSLTVYLQGDRQRREETWDALGPVARSSSIFLTQCDLKRTVTLDRNARTYVTTPLPDREEYLRRQAELGKAKPIPIDPAAGIVTVNIDINDTGERKSLNGLMARHIKEVVTQTVSPGSPVNGNSRVERDGWYLDIPYGCQTSKVPGILVSFSRPSGVGQPKMEFKRTGNTTPPNGILVMGTITSNRPNSCTTETVELVEATRAQLDPSLFDIPQNYRPALHLPNGGFDLKQPDTLINRIAAWWKQLFGRG